MTVLPALNALVAVRDEERDYRSRVEDVYDDVVVLARPMDLPLGHRFSVGASLMITWTGERGVFVLPATLTHQQTEGVVNLWVVQARGQGWVEQRRAYVRAEVAGPVDLTVGPETPSEILTETPSEAPTETLDVVRGQLVDLSEAALRCVVPLDSSVGTTELDAKLSAHFTLDGSDFTLPGRLQRAEPNALRPELREVVVLFDQPVRQADELRRLVYALQLKERLTR
ncbi:MAG: type pilus assembly PilZ [Frankiales bacterium]|nr:type pilus assembly PilZ [Frankiales bacterium]